MNLNELVLQLKSMDISDIIKLRIPLVRYGQAYKAICPFHNDKKIGSFVVTPSKGIFKCFSCDTGGDGIKFISLFDNISYVEAAVKLGLHFNLITQKEAESISGKKMSKKEIMSLQKIYAENNIPEEKKELDVQKIDYIYHYFKLGNTLIGKSKLSEEHLNYLKERGISDEEIKKSEYFTMPDEEVMDVLDKIAKICNINFTNVPGFFFNKKEEKVHFQHLEGIGIPIKNCEGRTVAIQVRKDKKGTGSRYVWFTSSFANGAKDLSAGTSSGAPVDVVLPEQIEYYSDESDYPCSNILYITEGHFKAEKLSTKCNAVAISVQGVNNWRGINEAIKGVYNRYNRRINEIQIAFDGDMVHNIQVFKSALKMYLFLKKIFGNTFKFKFMYWDEALGKGIDDVINNGNSKQVRVQDSDIFVNNYFIFVKRMLIEEKIAAEDDFKDITVENLFEFSKLNRWLTDITPETMKKYYMQTVLS